MQPLRQPIICPTVTAYDLDTYRAQLERIVPLTKRVHIDLMDGDFVSTKSPPLDKIWLPAGLTVDIHLMYQKPMDYLEQLVRLRPQMVVIHNEAQVHHMHFAAELHRLGIRAGLAVLQDTPIENAYQIMHSFDHVLIFSGYLGHHGGEADLGMLDKVHKVHQHHPDAEVGWDGGITADNAVLIAAGGVDVLNVGGFIQNAAQPADAYATLKAVLKV